MMRDNNYKLTQKDFWNNIREIIESNIIFCEGGFQGIELELSNGNLKILFKRNYGDKK